MIWKRMAAILAVSLCVGISTGLLSARAAKATNDISFANCVQSSICGTCFSGRGTDPAGNLTCFSSDGGSGSGSTKWCIYSNSTTQFCQEPASGGNLTLQCSGGNTYLCGPWDPATGNCLYNCSCSGKPTWINIVLSLYGNC